MKVAAVILAVLWAQTIKAEPVWPRFGAHGSNGRRQAINETTAAGTVA